MDVLAGGLVTLVVTFLVQVFVIPRVQASTRNRERWENDVVELRTLVSEEIPQAEGELLSGAEEIIFLEAQVGVDGFDQRKLEALIHEDRDRLEAARERCFDLVHRLSRVEGRVSLVNRRDVYWRRLTLARIRYHHAFLDTVTNTTKKPIVEDELRECNSKLQTARSALAEISKKITEPMKPPPRRLSHRLYHRTKLKLRDLIKRTSRRR